MVYSQILTWRETWALLGNSHSYVVSLERAGLIEKVGRGHYCAKSVRRIIECKTEGVKTSEAMALLRMSRTEVLMLARFGVIKRIMPEYNRSNFTRESILEARERKIRTLKVNAVHELMTALEDVLSVCSLAVDHLDIESIRVLKKARNTYKKIADDI